MPGTVAETMEPVVRALVGGSDAVPIRFWDGSTLGPESDATLVIKTPDALRRVIWSPGELGLGRAYVAGDIDLEGDIMQVISSAFAMVDPGEEIVANRLPVRDWPDLLLAAKRIGALGRPLPLPPEETRVRGRLHSKGRDATAVSHHYDVGNDFYCLFLGETMTYSCAYFEGDDTGLDDAQTSKYDLICRKLGLSPGMRLLDIGCGWGGMVIHAAARYGVEAVGVTLSEEQAVMARGRVADAGLEDLVEVRYQDYRDVDDGPFDAVSSIGMFEHVGKARLSEYFQKVRDLLSPQGRLLNHAISRPHGSPSMGRRSFVTRYVFPDGELQEVGRVVSTMQELGFEVRDVESLREHYAQTLRHWVGNLEESWEEAVALVGVGRARVWRLYMAVSALGFEAGSISVHQVLGIKPTNRGLSGIPATREEMLKQSVSEARAA
ncbi:MAG: class I SAM-dependent methyltransferase [Actinomycetota bacterium]|nr:class I SAM-dependent methyltransferase [Actinomycetota bacterium]